MREWAPTIRDNNPTIGYQVVMLHRDEHPERDTFWKERSIGLLYVADGKYKCDLLKNSRKFDLVVHSIL